MISLFCTPLLADDLKQAKLKLIGKALLEYSIFKIDVYDIAYYEVENPIGSLIELKYKRDIDRDVSIKGWSAGFKKLKADEQLKWLSDKTIDMKENDIFRIWRLPNNVTRLEKNGVNVGESNDPKLHEVVHLTWIGEFSVDEDLKKKLLGK